MKMAHTPPLRSRMSTLSAVMAFLLPCAAGWPAGDAPTTAVVDVEARGMKMQGSLEFRAGSGAKGYVDLTAPSTPRSAPKLAAGGTMAGVFRVRIQYEGTCADGPYAALDGTATVSGTFAAETAGTATITGTGRFTGRANRALGVLEVRAQWDQVSYEGLGLGPRQPFTATAHFEFEPVPNAGMVETPGAAPAAQANRAEPPPDREAAASDDTDVPVVPGALAAETKTPTISDLALSSSISPDWRPVQASSSFPLDVERVYASFAYSGVPPGTAMTVEWLDPSGSASGVVTVVADADPERAACYLAAPADQRLVAGAWKVRVSEGGQTLAESAFFVGPAAPAGEDGPEPAGHSGYTLVLCKRVTKGEPIGVGTVFRDVAQVTVVLKAPRPTDHTKVDVRWYQGDFAMMTHSTVSTDADTLTFRLEHMDRSKLAPGKYRVEVSVDGVAAISKMFRID